MSRFKKFESFVNEELNPKTYLSAAEKLKRKGHSKRADRLNRFAVDQPLKVAQRNIEPVTIEMYDNEYTIDARNIIVEDEKHGNFIIVEVCFDLDKRFDEHNACFYINFSTI